MTLHHHLEVMAEMITRDKNHPSVVMWSVANEPRSDLSIAEDYFKYDCTHRYFIGIRVFHRIVA